MSNLKYNYLFNSEGVLVRIEDANKSENYSLYPNFKLEYIVREGDVNRKHFSLKNANDFADIGGSGLGGESVEHYNAKMDVVYNKGYFDTIFNLQVNFFNVVPEQRQLDKIPDLSCYDENNILVACIEILKTNAKSDSDIDELKKIGVPIIEININDDNRCKHIILPKVLELNRYKYNSTERKISAIKNEIRNAEVKYRDVADKCKRGLSDLIIKASNFEKRIKGGRTERTEEINKWLQRRLPKDRAKEFRFREFTNPSEYFKTESSRIIEENRRLEIEIAKRKRQIEGIDYGNGKLETEIDTNQIEIKRIDKLFNKIAENSKIEWFRNKWMTSKPQNKLQEIKYWIK